MFKTNFENNNILTSGADLAFFFGLKISIFRKILIFMSNPLGFIHPPVDPTYLQSMGRFAADLCAYYPENHLVVVLVLLVVYAVDQNKVHSIFNNNLPTSTTILYGLCKSQPQS